MVPGIRILGPPGAGAPPGLAERVPPPGAQIPDVDDRVARHRDRGPAGAEVHLDVDYRMLDDRPGRVQVHPCECGLDLEDPGYPPGAAPPDPSADGGNRGRGARILPWERGQGLHELAVRRGGEHLVEAFVQLLTREVPSGVRLLQALHGRIAVVFAAQRRWISRQRGHPFHRERAIPNRQYSALAGRLPRIGSSAASGDGTRGYR